jgi:hypothetical protein
MRFRNLSNVTGQCTSLKARRHAAALGLALTLFGAGGAYADTVSIVINATASGTPTATYYFNNAAVGTSMSLSPAQSWDSMVTSANSQTGAVPATAALNVGTIVGTSADAGFNGDSVIMSLAGTSYWAAAAGNNSGSTEGALINAAGSGPTSSVQNLLVLDGSGYIYIYNAPGSPAVTGVSQYGYTGGYAGHNSYNPAGDPTNNPSGDPITQVAGLLGDLANNPGMDGNNDMQNMSVGAGQQVITAPNGTFNGYEYASDTIPGGDPLRLRETLANNTLVQYLSPTIYYEVSPYNVNQSNSPVPAPTSIWGCLSLIGLIGGKRLLGLRRTRQA